MEVASELTNALVAGIKAKSSDDELGKLLLEIMISAEAQERGIPPDQVTDDLEAQIVRAILLAEAHEAENQAVQNALHKAASGDHAGAGRLIRQHMRDGVSRLEIRHQLDKAIQSRLKGPQRGGAKNAELAKKALATRNKNICAKAEEHIKSGTDPRDVNSKLADRYDLTAGQIRRIRKTTK